MNTINLPRAQRVELGPNGGRLRRNVLAGQFLVAPIKPLVLHENGKDEVLEPERARLSPLHWAVKERPELFHPAMKGDRWTADRMRELLVRAEREVRREMRGGPPSPPRRVGDAPGPRLPRRQARKWKLP
jgi:hypothetical protein